MGLHPAAVTHHRCMHGSVSDEDPVVAGGVGVTTDATPDIARHSGFTGHVESTIGKPFHPKPIVGVCVEAWPLIHDCDRGEMSGRIIADFFHRDTCGSVIAFDDGRCGYAVDRDVREQRLKHKPMWLGTLIECAMDDAVANKMRSLQCRLKLIRERGIFVGTELSLADRRRRIDPANGHRRRCRDCRNNP